MSTDLNPSDNMAASADEHVDFGLPEMLGALWTRKFSIFGGALLFGLVVLGATYLIKPTFTARTVFMPPQQQQSATMAAIGAFAGLASLAAGGGSALKNPADQYVSLMSTRTIADRILDRFDLVKVYDEEYRVEARRELGERVRISAGKKDGLIYIEVDDHSPQRAADMATAYIEELRALSATLAITEAQQRRSFFERQLARVQEALTAAQRDLEASGFNPSVLRTEPRAAIEGFARLRAEMMAAEVKLQMTRGMLGENTPEVQSQATAVATLRKQLEKMRDASAEPGNVDYIGKYREYKYQETLFELFSRQYEMARVDEAREGALIQVVEPAEAPEKKSKPKRAIPAVVATLMALAALGALAVRQARLRIVGDGSAAAAKARWRRALTR